MSPAGLALEAIFELTIGLLRWYRSDDEEEDAETTVRDRPRTPPSDGTGPPYPPEDDFQSASSGRARR